MELDSLLAMGDQHFLASLDGVTDPEQLALLAGKWYADPRPWARETLIVYLAGSLNPFHEPLVTALLDLASRSGDDEVMGELFLLADRSLTTYTTNDGEQTLRPAGFERGEFIGDVFVLFAWPGSRVLRLTREQAKQYQSRKLFGESARLRLRRGVWEYFARLGREYPRRYAEALKRVLCRSVEADVGSERDLLAKWCLCHVLFGGNEHLRPDAEGRFWHGSEPMFYYPRPAFEQAWANAPDLLLAIMKEAASAKIRTWAARLLCCQKTAVLRQLPVDDLLALAGGRGEIVPSVITILQLRDGCNDAHGEHWPTLLMSLRERAQVDALLRAGRLPLERVSIEQAARLATADCEAAFVGWEHYLLPRLDRGDDLPLEILFRLLDAERHHLRQLMSRKVREELSIRMPFEPLWVLTFLEHRHPDVRQVGWEWFCNDARLRDDPRLWCRMACSSHEVGAWLLSRLLVLQQTQPAHLRDALPLDVQAARVLWARVVLTLYGPWKRTVNSLVRLLIARLEWRQEDAPILWPMLAEVLHVAKGPAWREALAGAVRLIDRHPQLQPLAAEGMPQLRLEATFAKKQEPEASED